MRSAQVLVSRNGCHVTLMLDGCKHCIGCNLLQSNHGSGLVKLSILGFAGVTHSHG